MSDPANSTGDIDDVLSSIRRLVAEQPGNVPRVGDTAGSRAANEEKLVLTPALRVTDTGESWSPGTPGAEPWGEAGAASAEARDRSPDLRGPDPDPPDDAEAHAAGAPGGAEEEPSRGDPAGDDTPDGMPGGEVAQDGNGRSGDMDADAPETGLQDMLANEAAVAGDQDAPPDGAEARLPDPEGPDGSDTALHGEDARPDPAEQDDADFAASADAGGAAPVDARDPGDAGPDAATVVDPGDPYSDSPGPEGRREASGPDAAAPAGDGGTLSPGSPDAAAPDGELAGDVAPAWSGHDTGTVTDPSAPSAEADDTPQETPDTPGGDGWRPEMRLFGWDAEGAERTDDADAESSAEFESDTGDSNWPDDGAKRAVLDLAAVREAAADSTRQDDAEAADDPDAASVAARGFTPHFSRRPADYEVVTPPEDVDGDGSRDAEETADSAGRAGDAGTDAAEDPTASPDRTVDADADPVDPSGAAAGSEIGGETDDVPETAGDGADSAANDLPAAEADPGEPHLANGLADDAIAAEPEPEAEEGDADTPAQSVFEPEAGAPDDAPASPFHDRPADEVAGSAIDAAVSDEIRNLRARLAGAVGSDVDPSLGDAAAETPDTPGASDFAIDEEGFIDEDALRRMVAEVVREELQGALGERITRNVRKLVRREIRLVLAADELD